MNNYQKIKEYLEKKVITIDNVINQDRTQSEQIRLRANWLTQQGLTTSAELTEVVTRFYQSLIATLTPDDKYHALPVYEDLITENYCTTQAPKLGLKASNSALEPTISQAHYQLLDQIVADSQKQAAPASPEFLACQNQGQVLMAKVSSFITSKREELGEDKEDPQANIRHQKKTLAKYPEWQAILTEIKTWLTDYAKLNEAEQTQLQNLFQEFDLIDKTTLTKPKKQKDQEEDQEDNTETPAKSSKDKDKDKNQQELIYFGGFIIALIALVALLKSERR